MTSLSVELHSDGIWIGGQPYIVLTSSLFYFRLPAAEWRSRMRTLRRLGYNAIDVYFPWNHHEREPGQWAFSDERDVRTFLQQAKAEGLWVIARPGPYICSEWDNGALPAYLHVKPELKLRDNDAGYLQAVATWYAHIMPVLAEFQAVHGGPVVLVQLENELDFFDCADRAGYMTALRDLALGHGIKVPLIACAGEGDIAGATGGADGIAPACNMYFDPRDCQLETRVRHYAGLVRKLGYPLCVIETNRSHTDLRRLLAGGAKLLGPYLQTSGTDFGFTASVTNWGEPLSFMTTHYDFGGMISPGGKVRPEGCEAILLTHMLEAFGPALALATPQTLPPLPVHGIDGHALALHGGGWLVGLPNPGQMPVQVHLGRTAAQFPARTQLTVRPNSCPFVLLDFPLSAWGIDARIEYATAELSGRLASEQTLALTFAVDGAAELSLQWPAAALGPGVGWQTEPHQNGWRFWLAAATSAAIEITGHDGKRLLIKAVAREQLGDLEKAGIEDWQIAPAQPESTMGHVNWRQVAIDPCSADWFAMAQPCVPGTLHMERNGLYRGFAWYRSQLARSSDLQGFLAHAGADVLSLYLDGQFLGTLVPGGGDTYVPLPEGIHPSQESTAVIRAEIWGHANFDDQRLPALRLNALRGMGGLTAIRAVDNLTPNWFYQHRAQHPTTEIALDWPLLYFGGWSTTEEPSRGVYYRDVAFAPEMDRRILYFPGLQIQARVFVDGTAAGAINPFAPYLDVSAFSSAGRTSRLAIVVEQPFRRPTGEVLLYQGAALQEWSVAGWDEAALAAVAEHDSQIGAPAQLPIALAAGAMAWLHADLPLAANWEHGWGLQATGQGMKLSAWLGKRLVGRLWLPSATRPRMAGGISDRMVLPAAWLRAADGHLHLLLECVDDQPGGEVSSLTLTQDI